VTWSILAALAGLLLGLRYRAPALIAATGVLVALVLLAGGRDGGTPRERLLTLIAAVLALQGAYLAGLLIGLTWRRLKRRRT
jgi:hypothetical protein